MTQEQKTTQFSISNSGTVRLMATIKDRKNYLTVECLVNGKWVIDASFTDWGKAQLHFNDFLYLNGEITTEEWEEEKQNFC